MKKKSFSISIPDPCEQDWQKMPRKDGGMYCESCTKVIHDFSFMSDEEIIQFLTQKGSERTCGKFRNEQLNRDFIPQTEKHYSFRPAKILLLSLFSLKFIDQVKASPDFVQTTNYFQQKKYLKLPLSISGKLTDFQSGLPLPNITVSILGHSIQTTSDSAGRFNLIVPDSLEEEKFTLHVGSSDYWANDTTIEKIQLPFVINFQMIKILEPIQVVGDARGNGGYTVGYLPMVPIETNTVKITLWNRIRMLFHRKRFRE